MNKKLPSWVMLCAVCLVGALALGLFNGLTVGGVDRQAAMLTDAVRDRALDADRFEALEVQEGRYNLDSLYAAQDAEGNVQGYVGQTTVTGYGGPIEVTVGVDNEGVITGVSVGGEGFAETPGLGARTREAAFTDQFVGKTPTITLNEGGVDTVSGASTTSRAVVSGVNTVANYIYINQLGLAEETETAFMGQTFSATEKGFGGDVTVTLGLDDAGAVAYMAVDTPNETDGLGKMASEPAFTGQFIGKKGPFTYGEDGIEALTGATFTSTAVINAANTIVNGGGEASGGPLTATVQGFGGDVTLNVMLGDDNTVSALTIDTPNETDGLGKLTSEPAFTDQFIGKAAPFAYGEDGIEAVSGATVTSTAVINGLNDLLSGGAAPAAAAAPAEEAAEAALTGDVVTVEKTTPFSTIKVEASVEDGKITAAKVTSEAVEGSTDLLTDDSRKALADQIVEKQDIVDAITGVTISSDAVKEAVAEILGQGAPAEEEAPAEEAPAEVVKGETVTVEKTTDFSTIKIEAVVADGKIIDAKITSEGATDLLTDDSRKALADQIVEKQDVVDAITGVTISSNAVKEAVAEILGQQSAPAEEEAAPAESVEGETITVEKTTDFSTITVEAVVADGKIVDAKITSEGATDLLTDDSRKALADQIVEKQDVVDAITGVTISSDAVKEAVAEILGQGAPAEEEAPAEEAPAVEVKGETVTVEKTTDFSTITVEAVVADGKIVDCKITSEGATDLLTDDSRKALADQIVEKQDVVDAITGVTISSNAVKEAVAEILGQDAPAEEEAPAEEAPAEAVEGETITVEKTTDFSTITVEAVVADGKIVDCKITSEGVTDLLTDDSRKALADQIVEKQDVVDAITGVTISSDAVKEAVAEILGQSAPAEEEAPAEEAPAEEVKGETVTVEKTTDFSTITVKAVVADGKIVDCKITSEGATDLLTDDSRKALADQIVEKQDVVDAITGVTISSDAVKEAVAEILGH